MKILERIFWVGLTLLTLILIWIGFSRLLDSPNNWVGVLVATLFFLIMGTVSFGKCILSFSEIANWKDYDTIENLNYFLYMLASVAFVGAGLYLIASEGMSMGALGGIVFFGFGGIIFGYMLNSNLKRIRKNR